MNEIFTPRWFDKVFRPLVKKAVTAKVNPRTKDRFIQWMQDHHRDEIRCMWGTINTFIAEVGDEYGAFVDDALVEVE